MLKRPITYENYDGIMVTETFWFYISKSELLKWEASIEEGFQETLKRMINTKDKKQLVDLFEHIILLAYGVREGDSFTKSDELRQKFLQTPAYDALFIELAMNEDALAKFVQDILPKDMGAEFEKSLQTPKDELLKQILDTPAEVPTQSEFDKLRALETPSTIPPPPPISGIHPNDGPGWMGDSS